MRLYDWRTQTYRAVSLGFVSMLVIKVSLVKESDHYMTLIVGVGLFKFRTRQVQTLSGLSSGDCLIFVFQILSRTGCV